MNNAVQLPSKRFGIIDIDFELIDKYRKIVLDFFKDKLVLEATNHFVTRSTRYTISCPSFRAISGGEKIPKYYVECIYKRVKIADKWHNPVFNQQELVKIELITDKNATSNRGRVID